jgi:hypothetical protein
MRKNTILSYVGSYTYNIYRFKILKAISKMKPGGRLPYPVKYNRIGILPKKDGSDYVEQLVTGEKPFSLVRLGGSELGAIHQYAKIRLGLSHSYPANIVNKMVMNAGFFPADDAYLHQYGALIGTLCPSIDVVTVYNQFMEDYIINTFCHEPVLVNPRAVSPVSSLWTRSLKGMKVLVIHPYAELIESQYKKRELLFPGTDILPEFDLKVFPAVQTSAGQIDPRFSTWFEALEYMMTEIEKIEFDIALIGAGAYGLPLAIRIKNEMNKKAVQMGGVLQILFGIRGKRWDHAAHLQRFFSEHWVRPGEKYTPKGADKVEEGCYW